MHFEDLLKRISPKLNGITHKLNGHFTFFNEEDLFQEAIVYLWQSFCAGKLNDKTESYILQGCYFHLKNYIRTVKEKAALVSLDAPVNYDGNENLGETLFLEDKNSSDFRDYLNSKLLAEAIQNNGLTQREKNILYFFAQGLTTRAIGKKVGISHVRVVKLKSRIKDKCKKYRDG
jgi:RNA polymerase sigma factor (sigma-70 family)